MLAAALLLPARAAAQGKRRPDAIAQLSEWVEELGQGRHEPSPEEEARLAPLCADVVLLHAAAPARGTEVAAVLLALAAVRPSGASFSSSEVVAVGSATARVQALGRETLLRVLASDEAAVRWMASHVLARSSAPLDERVAAARTLAGAYLPATRLALFASGIDADRSLRDASVAALVGWEDEPVHRFLVEALRRNDVQPGWIDPRAVRRHFELVVVPQDSAAARELADYVRSALYSSDWRRAYRGIQLAPGLPDPAIVPELIGALGAWIERRERGEGRMRLEGDLTNELRRRSGRNIGPHPERWATWWQSRQAARGEDGSEQDPGQATTAGFFGLHPLTDRVVFVLDRSGSMENAFPGAERTCYQEATEQLLLLLQSLGPETRFRVILFSDGIRTWSEDLRPASKANLGLVRRWMESNGPGGATHLRPAVEEALRIDARGRVDLERLDADTVIVLCDGATAEGPGWVGALMEGPGEMASVVFHSVQIGPGGNGTLERLAAESGGEFVRVDG